jgi:hypothetical protein
MLKAALLVSQIYLSSSIYLRPHMKMLQVKIPIVSRGECIMSINVNDGRKQVPVTIITSTGFRPIPTQETSNGNNDRVPD